MQTSIQAPPAESLVNRTATEAQHRWGSIARDVAKEGKIAITSHGHVEMVILSRAEYEQMAAALNRAAKPQEDPLDVLRSRFQDRLAAMQDGSMGDRIKAMQEIGPADWSPPAAGDSH